MRNPLVFYCRENIETSTITYKAPSKMHRIRDLSTYYDDFIELNSHMGKILPASDCCLNNETAQCSNTKLIRGISTYTPLNEEVNKAAHALFDKKGNPS